jgi:post-segregation antitoxin (ccd killing protein)
MRMHPAQKAEKTVPMNITVPESLRAEMAEHREINWSAVATRAFERQLRAQKILLSFEEKGVTDEEAAERMLKLERKK